MSGPVKILGDITDVNINNFAWMASGYKPGDDAYEEALVRLLSRGGDELRGVSDPLEKIFSAVSSYIEEYGMTPALRNQHTKITEALSEGRTISDFNKTYYEAMQYGETLRIAPEPTIPPKVSSSEPEPKLRGTLVDKRAASGAVPDPTPAPAPPAAVPEPSVDSEPKLRGSLVDKRAAAATTSASKAPASSVIDDTIAPEKPKSGPLKVGTSADVRTSPSDIGADAASSGGKVTASGATHTVADTVDLTTNNTNPSTTQPKAQAKIDSQNTAGGRTAGTQRPSGPGPIRKSKDMLDNGLRTAQDLAGGNARLMGIAAAAGLLGIGVVASRKKNNPAPDRGTYLDQSRRDLGY